MLARRPYSIAELRRALERKFGAETDVSPALARLRELGYLDDKQFAEFAAASLARNHGYGRHRARRELKAKLVNYKFIEPALERAYQETSERELLERTLEKKLRALRLPLTRARLAALCQSLLRRGFSAGDIMKTVRAHPKLRAATQEQDLTELEGERD